MTFPSLSLNPRRRNILIVAIVIAAVSGAATPSLRARLSDAIIGSTANVSPGPGILDPNALKTGTGKSDGKGPYRGTAVPGLMAGGTRPGAAALSKVAGAQLQLEPVGDSPASDRLLGGDDSKKGADLLSRGVTGGHGLGPSPLGARHGSAAPGAMAGGAGLGAFSSGLQSDFNHGQEHRNIAEAMSGGQASGGNATNTAGGHVVVFAEKFDPNRPFGRSDLTSASDETDPNALDKNPNASAVAPLAAPEPGTLLLVANGIAAALGSRHLRRKRNR